MTTRIDPRIDVLDVNGLRTGETLSRPAIHRLGKRHRAIRLYLFNRQNELLMQQRAATVDHYPNVYGISVVGHVDAGDILELDELWAFVYPRNNERWLWTVLCRRTWQIVAFVIGDRSAATCRRLWQAISPAYRRCRPYTDFWKSYQAVLPKRTHHPVGKETGQTAHQERWYLTLRQRVSRFVRKTLSFSKSECNHELVIRWFIVQYNLSTSPIWVESECLKRYKR